MLASLMFNSLYPIVSLLMDGFDLEAVFIVLIAVGGMLGLMGLVVFLAFRDEAKQRQHELELAKLKTEEVPPSSNEANSSAAQIIKEKEVVIKEVVMIPCQYCGSLIPQTSLFCRGR